MLKTDIAAKLGNDNDRGVEGNFHPFVLVDATNSGVTDKASETKERTMQTFKIDNINTLPRFAQTQTDLQEQLVLLRGVANRLGLYDAADHLKRQMGGK